MSAITYTALREIEPTGVSKTGTDISAAASDDSFNASSTVFTGFLADQWVLVSGFANAANNGWFQLSGNATAGKILQATPAMTHVRLPGVAGNYVSAPDSSANSVTGDFELIVKAALTDWTPAAVNTLIAKWNTTGNQRSYALSVNTAGTLNLSWSNDGTTVLSKNSTVATGVADLATKWVRATLDVNNGAAGNDVKFYLSDDGSTWTQLGTTVTTGGTTTVFNSTAVLEVGSMISGTSQLAAGRIYSASLLSSLGGATVAMFNGANATRNVLTFLSPTGETWTLAQSGTPPAVFQGTALVTEAAGQTVSVVGYARGLNQSYDLETGITRATRSNNTKNSKKQAIGGGLPEVINYRSETFIDVTTKTVDESAILQWREFLASVEGGETFTFDRYGTVASPVEPKTAIRSSDSYSEEREGSSFVYTISFQVQVF